MTKKCLVAVSGGVDSAVALYLLQNQGFDVEAVTMQVLDGDILPGFSDSETESARQLCKRMGVKHHVLDLKTLFKSHVIADFLDTYQNGETPNPCVVCNRFLKFGALAQFGKDIGADFFATGHYVRTERDKNGKNRIKKALFQNKDQSYVLWSLSREQIDGFIAPLGGMTKEQVRDIAESIGLSVAQKKDSQDICFIPDGNYRAFLDRMLGHTDNAGDFVLTDGTVVGKHKGQRCYTIGQRKGLGIALGDRFFVVKKDPLTNKIVLGADSDLYSSRIFIRELNLFDPLPVGAELECRVRTRYHSPEVEATLFVQENGKGTVVTKTPVRAVTPGQSCVFYDKDYLLGGSIIDGRNN